MDWETATANNAIPAMICFYCGQYICFPKIDSHLHVLELPKKTLLEVPCRNGRAKHNEECLAPFLRKLQRHSFCRPDIFMLNKHSYTKQIKWKLH